MEPITQLRDEHAYLDSFYWRFFRFGMHRYGLWIPTAEHAFQGEKAMDLQRKLWITSAPTAREAKRRGRIVDLRPDWEQVKEQIMYEVVWAKFDQNEDLATALIGTHPREIIEGNTWGDEYWGMVWDDVYDEWVGRNALGVILMEVRDQLMKARDNE